MRLLAPTVMAIGLLGPVNAVGEAPKRDLMRDWLLAQQDGLEKRKDLATKLGAIKEIEKTRSVPAACASSLVGALSDESAAVRLAAARALVSFGPLAKDEITGILQHIDVRNLDTDDEVRFQLLLAVQQMGTAPYSPYGPLELQSMPILLGALGDKSVRIRERAANAIGAAGPYARETVPDLIRALDDLAGKDNEEAFSMRFTVIKTLGEIGPAAASVVPRLIKMLRTEPRESGAILQALSSIGATHPDVVPTLVRVMNTSSNLRRRGFAAYQLGRIGTGAKDAVPALVEVLERTWPELLIAKSRDFELQKQALGALGMIGPAGKQALPVLLKYASGRAVPRDLRLAALGAMRQLGPLAKDAVPDLILILKDRDLTHAAGEVLISIGKEAVPAVSQLLRRGEKESGTQALYILMGMGMDAESARQAIGEVLKHSELGALASTALARLDKSRQR